MTIKKKTGAGRPKNAPRYGWSGEALRVQRLIQSMTQAHLAFHLGVSPPCVGRWENEHGAPTTEDVEHLALILDVTPRYLGKVPSKRTEVAILEAGRPRVR